MPNASSSNMDTKYLPSVFMPLITVDNPDKDNNNPQVEIFSSTVVKTIKLISVSQFYRVRKERLPVVARRVYGNTSCWWMILMASGQIHPLNIPQGALVALPDITAMRGAILVQANNLSRTPRYVTI